MPSSVPRPSPRDLPPVVERYHQLVSRQLLRWVAIRRFRPSVLDALGDTTTEEERSLY